MSEQENRTQITMSQIVTPDQANFSQHLHGGHLLKFLDEVAYACASRYAGGYVVTLSVDRVVFQQPIEVGELVTCLASVNYVGTSSMEIGIKVTSENLFTSEVRHTNRCFFTMVAVDENNKPRKIEPLKIETEEQQRRYDEAVARRAASKQLREAHEARKA